MVGLSLWPSTPAPPLPRTGLEVYLASRPSGHIEPSTHFGTRRADVPAAAALPPAHALVRVCYVSADPAMRGWMTTAPSYIRPVKIGETMRAGAVGEVVACAGRELPVGALVTGMLGWCEYAVAPVRSLTRESVPRGFGVASTLGVLGMTGLTAYFGLINVGGVRKGDVVLVSAAAGATGGVAVQLAKHVFGCHVVGIAGGARKCAYVRDTLGADACVDYKAGGLSAALKAALGARTLDVYFDNVGGAALEAALARLSVGARVVLCGAIGAYNGEEVAGPRNYAALITRRASMRGLIVFDFVEQYPRARRDLARWAAAGQLSAREDVSEGLENAPEALKGLFEGRNLGKAVVKVAEPFARGGAPRGKL